MKAEFCLMGIEKVKGPRTFMVGPLSGGLFPVLVGCEYDLWSVEAESMLRGLRLVFVLLVL